VILVLLAEGFARVSRIAFVGGGLWFMWYRSVRSRLRRLSRGADAAR